MSTRKNPVIQDLESNISNLQNASRERGTKPVTIAEMNKLDNLAQTLQGNIQHNVYILLGKAIIASGFNLDKRTINFTFQSEDGKVRDKGLQKRSGLIQSAMLRIKNNSHHLKNVAFFAELLPIGENSSMTKIFSTCINKYWGIFNNQLAMRNGQNIYDFCQLVMDYLNANTKITDDTSVVLYKIGKRFYSDGENGVNIRTIKFSKWLELFGKMADSRLKKHVNSEIVAETSERKKSERQDVKNELQAQVEAIEKWNKILVEMAMIEDISSENELIHLRKIKDTILTGNKDFNIIDTSKIKLAV